MKSNIKELQFGTAGIRGILGSGKDHLNLAHVQRVIHGFAKYLKSKYKKSSEIKVVIGRDNRKFSSTFAICAAQILDLYDIKVLFSKEICPTPFVSYAILKNQAQGGVNITASHNPAEYNGIKLYNSLGSQCLPDEIDAIKKHFQKYESYQENIKVPNKLKLGDYKNISFISKTLINQYLKQIQNVGGNIAIENIKVAYSPFHGTGSHYIPQVFENLGLKLNKDYFVAEKQMVIDREFTYCPYPNPERMEAYDMLHEVAVQNNCDILLATDPDSDRVGLAVKHNDKYVFLNGNETATLIFDFIIKTVKNDKIKNYLVYSFVSSNMPALMAQKHSINVFEVATGFKWIGKVINQYSNANTKCLFAFEESYGSLINEELARDKDALQSVVMLTKMASYYKKLNKTLIDVLNNIYDEYGYIKSDNVELMISENVNLEELQEKFKNINLNDKIIDDYNLHQDDTQANMIKIKFNNEASWIAMRPSGTEPKIKFYIFAFSSTKEKAQTKFEYFQNKIYEIIN